MQMFSHMQTTKHLPDPSVMLGYDYTSYFKDQKLRYITCNQSQANLVGYNDSDQLIGLNDFDLFSIDEAQMIHNNDLEVIRFQQIKVINEPFTSCTGAKMMAISIKTPLLTATQKVVGVAGISIIQPAGEFLSNFANEYSLTKKQLDCLLHLVKGRTVKEIAKKLNLSHRTVGHYLDTIKFKMNCECKSEMIEKALRIIYIKNNL
jgi:DNA-binding CsgD family transcriptional regulator